MADLIIVDNPKNWHIRVPGVKVESARRYLTDPEFTARHFRVFNLCRSYSYQSLGYYVSLLAEARGHRPRPDIVTIQDLKSATLSRIRADDLDDLIDRTLRPIKSERFELSIYFGRTLAQRDQRLGSRLFGLFPCPFLRATFAFKDHWELQHVRPIPASEIPERHLPDVIQSIERYFSRPRPAGDAAEPPSAWLAILVDPKEEQPPSDAKALERFERAARQLDLGVEFITKEDFGRLGEFDALFIRTYTAVDHYTYRFARRAVAEGMPVLDDPVSIVRCSNKVFQAERLTRARIATPRTMVVHRENVDEVIGRLGLPVVLKAPDSAFSRGVSQARTEDEFRAKVMALLAESELVVAQEFVQTDFDWRIGVLDQKPLYACRYYMAREHWQILKRDKGGNVVAGKAETLPLDQVPPRLLRTAVRAAKIIGNGLYGIDLKQVKNRVYVIEINDNPNLDAGCEDAVLKQELYRRIVGTLVHRLHRRRNDRTGRG